MALAWPVCGLAASGLGPRAASRWGHRLGIGRVVTQGHGSLGLRMQRQMLRGCREGAPAVVVIGSDLPELTGEDLVGAFRALEHASLVLGPAGDGGYWLIGRRGPTPSSSAASTGAAIGCSSRRWLRRDGPA